MGQLISWGSIYYLFALIMVPIEEELGLSCAQSSLAFSWALLVEGLLAYSVGQWVDRGYERLVMTAGSMLLGLCLLAHSFVTTKVGFYAAWGCIGAGMVATLYNPAFAVVTRRFPQDFRRAIITLTFLRGLASTVFLPLSAWLISAGGWRQALMGLFVILAMTVMAALPTHIVSMLRELGLSMAAALTLARAQRLALKPAATIASVCAQPPA